MVKLIKVNDAWYTEFSGGLFTRESPTEDISQWELVKQLGSDVFDKIYSEFPDAAASFYAAGDGATYNSGTDVPTHVREVTIKGPGTGPDKYVTYHAAAVIRTSD